MTSAPIASTDDSFAWDVIAQVSALLAPVAEAMGGAVMAAFEVAEDASAERDRDGGADLAPHGAETAGNMERGG